MQSSLFKEDLIERKKLAGYLRRLYSGQKPFGTCLRKFLNRQASELKLWPWQNHLFWSTA